MDLTFRPIQQWPGEMNKFRQRSKFRSSYTDTLQLLDRELRHLKAKDVVLQVALPESQIRLDGKPYAGARAQHPGVILSFASKYGPLSYPCDRYSSWEENLRAIALSLESLRSVDRYGVTRRAEQYRGWTPLPAPAANSFATAEEARAFVMAESGLSEAKDWVTAYRAAAMRLHPDRGGDPAQFKRLQAAKELIGL